MLFRIEEFKRARVCTTIGLLCLGFFRGLCRGLCRGHLDVQLARRSLYFVIALEFNHVQQYTLEDALTHL